MPQSSARARIPGVEILIIGGGIGGLTLALSLHQAGIGCRVFEAAPEIKPLGVGINLLPHGMRELTELGLAERLARVAVETQELRFYNRFGQLIYREPRGRFAGYDWPQLSIHRADLHEVLLQSVLERSGKDAFLTGHRCVSFEEKQDHVNVTFEGGETVQGSCVIGCDGIHSAVRKRLFPGEGPPAYQGIDMWRGVTRARPFLSGASMAVAGWLEVGKLVVYPIRDAIDAEGRQLVNWVAEIQSPRKVMQDWSLGGRLEDFYPAFSSWRFDWLDCAALIRQADMILEYPMVDRDPLPWWTRGRVTLLGDAAHPMYPRGSNGAGQAILDARALAGALLRNRSVETALKEYETIRLQAANDLVLMNRSNPPDAILREVWQRSGDRPFARIEDLISGAELAALSEGYKRVAGFERDALARRESLVRPGEDLT
ncbi:MAG: flavin-dependent oxidoreductase [Betaproteobacteria bacterium]|nr:flavin-dependent oxidoreductase [Betaproteobacteria bacterium]